MKTRTLVVTIGIAVLVVGCVRTSTVMLGGLQRFAPVDPSQVVVFVSEEDVPGEYVKIAYISAEGAHGWTSESGMVDAARREAAQLGANAVVINEMDEPSAGAKIAGGVLGIPVQRTGRLLAIRYDAALTNTGIPVLGDYHIPQDVAVYPTPDTSTVPDAYLTRGHVVTVVGRDDTWATVRYAMGKQAYLRIADVPEVSMRVNQSSDPCADSLYQVLRKKDLNEMSEREFLIFRSRDQACAVYSGRGRIPT